MMLDSTEETNLINKVNSMLIEAATNWFHSDSLVREKWHTSLKKLRSFDTQSTCKSLENRQHFNFMCFGLTSIGYMVRKEHYTHM
jgi:hypothetical protein